MCLGCSSAVVSLSSRCSECKARVSDAQFKMTAPRAQNLPKLQQNRVVQLSLGATEAVLSKGLPARARVSESKKPAVAEVFVVEKIIDKRRVKSKVEYLVVWEGYTSEHNSWEPISSFKGRSRAIDDFESTHIPPHCVKKGNDVCSCGDTGCDGPRANYNDHSVSSSSSSATVTQKQVPAEASVAVVTKQVVPIASSSSSSAQKQVVPAVASVAVVKSSSSSSTVKRRSNLKTG